MLAPGSDRLPVELFQILKDYAVKVLHSICNMLGDGSRQKYVKAVYCHPVYLTSMQSTS